jgi:mannose PTS system EIID component
MVMRGDWRPQLLARSFFVQGAFNYRSLMGGGFTWVMLPVLRRTYANPDELSAALQRHALPFNAHPYLVGIAAGAVTKLEQDGVDPATIAKFKDAIRGPLGSLGDRLVWAAVRPALLLGALLAWALGAPPWLIVASFLILYNAVHVGLRWWGLSIGLREGMAVGRRLKSATLGRWADRLARVGCVLLGLVSGVLVTGPLSSGPQGWLWSVAAVACFVFGVGRGARSIRPTRLVLVAVLSLIAVMGLI